MYIDCYDEDIQFSVTNQATITESDDQEENTAQHKSQGSHLLYIYVVKWTASGGTKANNIATVL